MSVTSVGFDSVDSGGWVSWHAPSSPAVVSIDLEQEAASLTPAACAIDFNHELTRPILVGTRSVPLHGAPPRIVSVPIGQTSVRVRSFLFDAPADEETDPIGVEPSGPRLHQPSASTLLGKVTRIKPPRDVIKLDDRLQYLLQPPLESLLAERSLMFPFHPFPFQFEGIAFLYPRHAAILADEMGLGKTMQAITAIRLLLRQRELRTVLLVCPKPLVTNWQREFELWAPEITVSAIEGDQPRREWLWRLPDVPVKIANYELLLRDRALLEGRDRQGRPQVHFDLMVLDESQRIKNRTSTTSHVVRAVSRRRSWALTGTPVENSAEDLVGIFEFLSPGFLSSEMKPRRMGRAVSDHILRRTKDQVLTDLPPKLFKDAEMSLTPEQRESYRMAEDDGVVRLTELGDSACIQHVFELVLRLKQICNFDPATGASAKLERLEADMEEIARSGRKAILFSQWVGTITRLAKRLDRFGPLQYHGKIPSGRRDAVIRQFREDDSKHLILMSYGAGGVGLNLQFANYVFLFDRWWNPALEDQAINRAHRIGVSGPVTVTRLLMIDTIEERIDRILQEKRELFDTIFSGAESHRKLGLSQQELFGLFQLKCPGRPIDVAA